MVSTHYNSQAEEILDYYMSLNTSDSVNHINQTQCKLNKYDNHSPLVDPVEELLLKNPSKLSCRKTLSQILLNVEDMAISNSMALICALSIPDSMCATTHADFLDRFEKETSGVFQKSEIRTIRKLANSKYPIKIRPKKVMKKKKRKWRRKKVVTAIVKPLDKKQESVQSSKSNSPVKQETIVDDGRTPCCSKSLLESTQLPLIQMDSNAATEKSETVSIKENNKPKPKTKRWMEDEKPVVAIISENELLINGKLVVIDYTNFTKEVDVPIDYEQNSDEDYSLSLPGFSRPCKKDYCRLGCICDCISATEIVRTRCQNVKCMFGCICFPSSSNSIGGDDGDIRSRLRPRVSLLNWKHSDNTDKDAMANYKQLERGIISLRTKRASQPPSRLRNEYILDGVRNPLQTIQQRSRRRHIEQSVNQHPLNSVKAGRSQVSLYKDKSYKMADGRSATQRRSKRIYSEEVDSSEINSDNNENEVESSIHSTVGSGNDIITLEKPPPQAEELTVLYHKIGTAPKINDQFIKSCTTAIKSYTSLRKVVKASPQKELLARQDGTLIFINWTLTSHGPTAVSNTKYTHRDKSIPGDQINLPLLPEGSEWLIYELPKHYEKSSYVSFTDIHFIMLTKVMIFHKIYSDHANKVVRLKLKHSERKNTKTSMYLYLLPRMKNIIVMGPVKKDFVRNGKITLAQTYSYVSHINRNNFLGSDVSWDSKLHTNQQTLAEPFHIYVNRKKKEDSERLTGRFVPPETMDQMIPELVEMYEQHEIPAIVRQALLPSQQNNIILPLKWTDSMRCSAGLHPKLQKIETAIPLNSINASGAEEIWLTSSDSEIEEIEHNPPEVKSWKTVEMQEELQYEEYPNDESMICENGSSNHSNVVYISPEDFSNFKFENNGDGTKAIYEDEEIVEVLEFDPPQTSVNEIDNYVEALESDFGEKFMSADEPHGEEIDTVVQDPMDFFAGTNESYVPDPENENDIMSSEIVETIQYVEVNEEGELRYI